MRLIDVDMIDDVVSMLNEKGRVITRHEYKVIEGVLFAFPTIDAVEVDGYTEWLEKLIVDLESFEWICEDTPCPEWCEENCNYSSIQAECLRHLYEASKGGDSE